MKIIRISRSVPLIQTVNGGKGSVRRKSKSLRLLFSSLFRAQSLGLYEIVISLHRNIGFAVWERHTWDSFRWRSDASRRPLASI